MNALFEVLRNSVSVSLLADLSRNTAQFGQRSRTSRPKTPRPNQSRASPPPAPASPLPRAVSRVRVTDPASNLGPAQRRNSLPWG